MKKIEISIMKPNRTNKNRLVISAISHEKRAM